MARTMIGDLGSAVGTRVRVCGLLEARSGDDGRALRDVSGVVTLVRRAPGPEGPSGRGTAAGAGDLAADSLATAAVGSALEVVGRVVDTEGGLEVDVDKLHVAGPAAAELPIDDTSPLADRLDWRFLDLRRPRNRLVFEVQTTAERVMREHWRDHGFLELHTPKLRPTPNQSGVELFTVGYFDRSAYLAQSPQFSKQMAMAAGFDRIFEVGPAFRAQPDATPRHATEFTSVDVEMSWIDSHTDVMAFEETWLHRVITAVADEHGDDVKREFGVDVVVPEVPFPRLTLAQAHEILAAAGHQVTGRKEGDLDPAGERIVAEHMARRTGHEFVFLTEYPEEVRAFYHMRLEHDPSRDKSFDLLWKGLEITTGAQREHRYDRLVDQAQVKGVSMDIVGYYLDFFKYGCPPHGGFGLGLTRFLMSILGVDDVREVTYLHRGPDRLQP
ncbi:MAG: aspartate--tRNA(Asn) ligase [Acidimicrobiales bacterium]